MLNGPVDSPLFNRRNYSKNGTIAAGFSIGIPAVRSIHPVTSSLAVARAFALTGGAFGTRLFFLAVLVAVFFFFALEVEVVAAWERKKTGATSRSKSAGVARSGRIDYFGFPVTTFANFSCMRRTLYW